MKNISVEIVGQQLRIKFRSKRGYTKIRIHDVGRKGYLQRATAYIPEKGWVTYGWRLNLRDFRSLNGVIKTIDGLKIPSSYKRRAIRKAKKWWIDRHLRRLYK